MIENTYIVKNLKNFDISQNELVNGYVFNRNLERLIENDKKLLELYNKISEQGGYIKQYSSNTSYKKNDVIWYVGTNPVSKTTFLFLLQSLYDNNTTEPKLEYDDETKIYNFEKSGWRDLNSFSTLMNNNISSYVNMRFTQRVDAYHAYDTDWHYFGELTNDSNQILTKLMERDCSNISPERNTFFYPYETVVLEKDNVIKSGYYRKWDNGLLEYDIIFKLAYEGNDYLNNVEYEVLKCNNLSVDSNIESNNKYFLDEDAKTIFFQDNPEENYIRLGGCLQTNRNKWCNAYSATIKFSQPFVKDTYMIFNSDVRCQERNVDKQSIDSGANSMTYVNRKTDSIDALLLVYPCDNRYSPTRNGLVSNSFHIQVIGRWK